MKIRSIPYGYMYKNGSVIVNTTESRILLRIFDMYLYGKSLQQIASTLNAEQIEYQTGVISWNSSRLMRIIEDNRYTGTQKYPSIINSALHAALVEEKSSRNKQIHIDRSCGVYSLNAPIICPRCGSAMHRRNDTRNKCPQKWVCKNQVCRFIIPCSDGKLLTSITEILNQVIYNPAIIDIPAPEEISVTESIELESKINLALCSPDFDRDTLRQTMLDCVSAKYRELDQSVYISKQLQADFEKSSPLAVFSIELFSRTVMSIHFSENGNIRLKLINGQYIAKE